MAQKKVRDCRVCLVEHEPEIHDATLRVREWLRREVLRKLGERFEESGPRLNESQPAA